jgi:two-component system LytT family response regulator
MLRVEGRQVLLDEPSIEWIDASRNYVRFNVGDVAYRVRGTLQDLERTLPTTRFLRVHRSTIVNIDAVAEFSRRPHGDLVAVLRSGRRLTVGRSYRRALLANLKNAPGILVLRYM